MPLAGTFLVSADFDLTSTLDLQAPIAPLDYIKRLRLTTGTGADQADKIWTDTVTLAASATADLDVAGSLTDALGGSFVLARLKGIIVAAAAGNTNNVLVSRPASNGVPLFSAASDAIPVLPNGVFAWFAPGATGIPVTASTGDLITFTNSAGTTGVTYDVVLIGASA